jgi:hypothetical protein
MITDVYKTRLGTKFRFGFELREIDGAKNYVMFILDSPSYGGRDDGVHITHRIREGDDWLVCWVGPVPSIEDARVVCANWSCFTERYIMTGQPFPA